jgi:hypothetical protein
MTVIIILKKDQLESQGESTTMWWSVIKRENEHVLPTSTVLSY